MEIVKWLLIYCFFGSIKVANAFNIGGYDTEIKNAGRFIASVLARPNGHGSIVQQCERLSLDLDSLLDGCRISGNTASCRAWWHTNRQEFAPKIGQFLTPSYVQYYSALKDLAGKCLQQRTRPSVIEMQREELTPKFIHYFLDGHRNANASSSTMHGTNDVILFYHEVYRSAEGEALYHRAILVHNSVIHYVGQKGIYVETLEEYKKNVFKDGFDIESQPLGQQTHLTPEQIQIQLDSWVGTGHGHEFGMFAAGEFSRSDNNCHHFTMKLLDLLYSNNTSQGTRDFMEGLFNKGSPELRKAYDKKLKAEKAADKQKEMLATHLGGF